jgi:hypothetical protein
MTDRKGPAHGLHGDDKRQSALRDTRGGTYGPPDRGPANEAKERRSPSQDEQKGADVRPEARPRRDPLPEGLHHRTGPLNKSSGRRRERR